MWPFTVPFVVSSPPPSRRCGPLGRTMCAGLCRARLDVLVSVVLAHCLLQTICETPRGPVLSAELDGELSRMHATMQSHWERVINITAQLQALGAITPSAGVGSVVGGLPAAGLGPALGPRLSAEPRSSGVLGAGALDHGVGQASLRKVPHESLESLRTLHADFTALQDQAFRIGRESDNNDELRVHPDVNHYMQSMREFQPKIEDMVKLWENEYKSVTGKQLEKAKKKKKAVKTIQGLSVDDIRSRVASVVASDSGKPLRSRMMDAVSVFRERQLQMQDKQRDLQVAMDGPDWPKEDWPLSSDDAKNVGQAEDIIQASLAELNSKLNPLGGLGRAHESTDESLLEQMLALNDMMSGYGEIIERHVESVRRVYKRKRKASKNTAPKAPFQTQTPLGAASGQLPSHGSSSLRDKLLSFGNQAAGDQPFAWLHKQEGEGAPPMPGLGSSSLGSLGGFGATPEAGSGSLGGTPGSGSVPNGFGGLNGLNGLGGLGGAPIGGGLTGFGGLGGGLAGLAARGGLGAGSFGSLSGASGLSSGSGLGAVGSPGSSALIGLQGTPSMGTPGLGSGFASSGSSRAEAPTNGAAEGGASGLGQVYGSIGAARAAPVIAPLGTFGGSGFNPSAWSTAIPVGSSGEL